MPKACHPRLPHHLHFCSLAPLRKQTQVSTNAQFHEECQAQNRTAGLAAGNPRGRSPLEVVLKPGFTDIWPSGAFHYGILHFLFLSGRRALGLGLHDAFSFPSALATRNPRKSTTAPSTSNKMEEKEIPKATSACHLRSISQFKISVGISLQLQPMWNLDIPSPQVFLQKGLKVLIISQLNSVYMCKRRTEALVHSVGLFPKILLGIS